MWSLLKNWVWRDDGQSLVEYALILGLIAIVLVAGLTALNVSIADLFNNVVGVLGAAL